jgi:hypothetical protein
MVSKNIFDISRLYKIFEQTLDVATRFLLPTHEQLQPTVLADDKQE